MAKPIEYYHEQESGQGVEIVVGLVVLATLLFLFFYYGIPILQGGSSAIN